MFTANFPLPFSSQENADLDFQSLKTEDFSNLLMDGPWFSRSEFDQEKYIPKYINIKNIGGEASHFYHAGVRYACDSLNSPSVIRGWFEPKIRKTLESSVFFESNPATALVLRKYLPSQFRPSAAKCLFDILKPKTYYDFCGGWGDRLNAAMAAQIPEIYIRDVNPLVFCGYQQQVNRYSQDSKVFMELCGCETELKLDKKMDLIFSSPPYWKAEHYQGELQSFRKFKKFDSWLSGFLFKTIENNLTALSDDGLFIMNVSDVYANHTYNRIIQPVLDTFGSKILGIMGYRMRKRINSQSDKEGTFAEPMLIFGKTNNLF